MGETSVCLFQGDGKGAVSVGKRKFKNQRRAVLTKRKGSGELRGRFRDVGVCGAGNFVLQATHST